MATEDRDAITAWAHGTAGRLLDAGSGPGHWSDAISAGGLRDVAGVDVSTQFAASAHERFPHVSFVVGDLAELPIATGSISGVLAWFSIIHTPPADVPQVLSEFARVLAPGGSLLLGFFDGEAREPFNHAVTTAYYWSAEALGDLLSPHAFVVERSGARQDPGARRQGHLVAQLLSAS